MKKAINKKALVISIISLAVAVVIAAVAWLSCYFYYRPSYLKSEKTFDIKSAPITDEITVMSYNLRYLSAKDCLKKSWFYRADLVIDIISEEKPDLIGFQEANDMMRDFLTDNLAADYTIIGCGRDSDCTGESTAVAVRRGKFAVVSVDNFWLSFTPDVPGTDSFRLREAGAEGVAVFSGQRYLLTEAFRLTEQDLLALFERHGYDLVLMEGFKESGWPKIEVVRSAISNEPASFEPLAVVGDVP